MRRFFTFLLAALLLWAPPPAQAGNQRTKPKIHVVYAGQTLGAIAKRYNVTIEAICRASGIQRRAAIKPKQRLVIPASHDKDGSEAAKSELAKPKKKSANQGAAATEKTAKRRTSTWKKYARPARRAGYIKLQSVNGKWEGYLILKGNKLSSRGLRGIRKVLASWRTRKQVDIDERLVRLLAKVSDTFGGRPLKIVSGYREHSHARDSRHKKGLATDFSIPGVPNEALRDYLRTLGNVGVGYYPNSNFVHLDVRPGPMYWVDVSKPGERPRYTKRVASHSAANSKR